MDDTAVAPNSHAPTRSGPAGRKRKRRKTAILSGLQLLLVAGVVLAVGIGLWQAAGEQSGQGLAIPSQIAGYDLTDSVRGQEAIVQLTKLHGKDVGLTSGWIGYYQNKAVAWVGAVPDEARGEALLQAMNGRIAAGNGPFINLQKLASGGVPVYTVTGMGQRHYYYRQGTLVIWLTAPSGGEERFLKGALETIR